GLASAGYVRLVGSVLRVSIIVLILYCGLLDLTWLEFGRTPKGFIPSQDMGFLMVSVQLPDSASTERTARAMRQIEEIARRTPGIKHITCISGMSFMMNAAGSNFGSGFINLNDYPDRRDPSLSSEAIANNLRAQFNQIVDAGIFVFPPPPVRG